MAGGSDAEDIDMRVLRMHLDRSALSHNQWHEAEVNKDWRLTGWVLEHPLLKGAMDDLIMRRGISRRYGVIAEIGSFLGVTFYLFTKEYAQSLPEMLFLGVDKGDYADRPCDTVVGRGFSGVEEAVLLGADTPGVLNLYRVSHEPEIRVFQDARNPNSFLAYRTVPEKIFNPGARLDLVLMKCMLGYVPLSYVESVILPMADRVFIFDYVGRCEHKRIEIPSPVDIESVLTATGMAVQKDAGQHYFAIAGARV